MMTMTELTQQMLGQLRIRVLQRRGPAPPEVTDDLRGVPLLPRALMEPLTIYSLAIGRQQHLEVALV